ncbi:hypothetical protein QE438_003686 [Pseudoxanthomonas sp. SORGH_AS 997]|nr:hypothetical protein [Pseudoxanthomonas sp. SORGH_AS_0997]
MNSATASEAGVRQQALGRVEHGPVQLQRAAHPVAADRADVAGAGFERDDRTAQHRHVGQLARARHVALLAGLAQAFFGG